MAFRQIKNLNRDAFGCVPGSFKNLKSNIAELDAVAILYVSDWIFGFTAAAQIDCRANPFAQLDVTSKEVRMEVSQKHMANGAALAVRILNVLFNVTLRIDDRGRTGFFVCNKVGHV